MTGESEMTLLNILLYHTPLFYLTQSFWRDEAFSVLFAQRSPLEFLKVTFEPPLYYLLLHYWMKIFGTGETAVRSLSLVGFSLATVVVIHWSGKLFKSHWLSWFLPVFFFFNPMLIYYGVEARTYGWYMFFAIASMYAYMNDRFLLYVIATALGLYTHTYMVIVPAVQVLHYIVIRKQIYHWKRWKTIRDDPMIRAFAATIILFAPWLIHVILDLSKLSSSWYFPVDFHLVVSVLGNMFVGYEGTPWFLWSFTQVLSLILLIVFVGALLPKKSRERNSFFFMMIFIPLIVTIGISFIKPLFVIRYVIPVTIAEVFLVALAIEKIKHRTLQIAAAAVALLFIIGFNMWYPEEHPKLDSRSTFFQINALMGKDDIILVDNPLIYFESKYYSKDKSKVFFYDPNNVPFPWYVGDVVVSPSEIVKTIPVYPERAFLVHADATYEIVYGMNISRKVVPPARHK